MDAHNQPRDTRTLKQMLRLLSSDAFAFVESQPDMDSAYAACTRSDWMLALAALRGAPYEKLVLAACECIRLALPFASDPRVLDCIEASERWGRGEATLTQLRDAREAASRANYESRRRGGDNDKTFDADDADCDAAAFAASAAFATADIGTATLYANSAFAAARALDYVFWAVFMGVAARYARSYTKNHDVWAELPCSEGNAAADKVRKQCADIVRRHFPVLPNSS